MIEAAKKEKKKKAIEYYAEVPVFKYTAMNVGITRETLYQWMKEDLTFLTQLQEARSKWVAKNVRKCPPTFSLERLEREEFIERKEIEIKDNPLKKLLEEYQVIPKDDKAKHRTSEKTEG